MTFEGLLQLIFIVIIGILSFITNKDVFSPTKWYLLTLLIYFAEIFWESYPLEVHLTYTMLVLIGGIFALAEQRLCFCNVSSDNSIRNFQNPTKIALLIWILSIPSVLAQIYMIKHLGGFVSYVNLIDLRVQAWQGLGFFVYLIGFTRLLSIVYFAVGLKVKKPILSFWWSFFTLHFLLTLSFGLLSGGRGRLLGAFVAIIVIYHYLKHPIRFRTAVFLVFILLITSLAVGIIRTGFAITESGVRTGYDIYRGRFLEKSVFRYGLQPLRFIYKNMPTDYAYGTTYLAGITNLIPSQLLKYKFDSGGVLLTRYHRGGKYTGTSHWTPTSIGEGIINFGAVLGVFFGVLILLISFVIALYVYSKMISGLKSGAGPKTIIPAIIFYYYLGELPASLVKGEFANMFSTKIATIVFLYFVFFVIMRTSKSAVSTT
jgi:hypothetical protein